jgi:hypothetical protein
MRAPALFLCLSLVACVTSVGPVARTRSEPAHGVLAPSTDPPSRPEPRPSLSTLPDASRTTDVVVSELALCVRRVSATEYVLTPRGVELLLRKPSAIHVRNAS